jgi:hypothetical protein
MSPTQPLPSKKEVALSLLERSSVYVHLDPRHQVADVPPRFKKQPQLGQVEAVAKPERSDVVLYASGEDPYRTMVSPRIEAPRGLLVRLRAFLRRRFGWFRRQRRLK